MAEQNRTVQEKGIAIGVVGTTVIAEKILAALKSFPNFRPIVCTYTCEEEIPVIVAELAPQVEVMMFAAYRAFRQATARLDVSVPVHYVPLSGAGLYSALYRLQKRSGLQKLSIDCLTGREVARALLELGEAAVETVFFPGSLLASPEELVHFHGQQAQAVKDANSVAVLTGDEAVAEALTAQNISNEYVTPTHQDIIGALERALLSTETRRSKEAQIVVGLINVDQFSRLVANSASEHDVQKLKLDLHGMFLDYVKSLEGHLTSLGGDEYLFFTTRGIFERETRGYKFIPLLQESKKSFGHTLSVGIGFGKSANEAGTHARIALRQAKEAGGDVCYIVREDKCVIGPVEMGPQVVYELSVTDEKLLEKAEQAGMSATYMRKLLAQATRFGTVEYTAHELAPVLGVTIRSTHRILLQWLDAGLVEIVGEEKLAAKGRPRQVYRFVMFDEER